MMILQNRIIFALLITVIVVLYNYFDDNFNSVYHKRNHYIKTFVIIGGIVYMLLPYFHCTKGIYTETFQTGMANF